MDVLNPFRISPYCQDIVRRSDRAARRYDVSCPLKSKWPFHEAAWGDKYYECRGLTWVLVKYLGMLYSWSESNSKAI